MTADSSPPTHLHDIFTGINGNKNFNFVSSALGNKIMQSDGIVIELCKHKEHQAAQAVSRSAVIDQHGHDFWNELINWSCLHQLIRRLTDLFKSISASTLMGNMYRVFSDFSTFPSSIYWAYAHFSFPSKIFTSQYCFLRHMSLYTWDKSIE